MRILLLAGAYFAAGKVGLSLALVADKASLVWPAIGIALAALLVMGNRYWPGVALGAFLVNLSADVPRVVPFMFMIGTTLEAVAASYLLRRYADFDTSLERVQDVLALLLGAALSAIIASTIGATTLALTHLISSGEFGPTWLIWWSGDGLGMLVVTPVLLTWRRGSQINLRSRWIEAGLAAAVLVSVCLVVFSDRFTHNPSYLSAYAAFPVLIWIGLRFGQREAATASFLVSYIAVWSTSQGYGPFAAESLDRGLLAAGVFMGTVTLTIMLLAAISAERQRVQATLQGSNSNLAASRDALRRLVDQTPIGIQMFDTGGLCIDANPAYLDIFGISDRARLVGEYNIFRDPLAVSQGTSAGLRRALGGEVVRLGDLSFDFAGTASRRIINITLFPVFNEQKQVASVVALNVDMTERKQAEEALRASETRYRNLFNSAKDMIFVRSLSDDNLHIRFCEVNDVACQTLGYTRDELLLHTPQDITVEDVSEDAVFARRLFEEGHVLIERTLRAKDGKTIPVEINSHTFVLNGQHSVLSIARDITERKAAEAALKESEERYRQLLDMLPVAVTVHSDGKIVYINRAGVELWGASSPDEIVGTSILNVVHPDFRNLISERIARIVTENTQLDTVEIRAMRLDGKVIETEGTGAPVTFQGRPAVQSVVWDITRRKQSEAAEHEQRMLAEALGETAAVLNSTLELDEVLDRILTQVERFVPFDAITVMVIDAGEIQVIRHEGHTSHGTTAQQLNEMSLAFVDAPVLHHMIRTKGPIAISDVGTDPDWRHFSEEARWIRSYVGAPLVFQGHVLGFINLDSSAPGTFTEEHAQRLMAFANHASIAIQNARYAASLERRVFERTAQLELERRQLEVILDATGEGIFYSEGETIRYANRALLAITGYAAEELIGKPTTILTGALTEYPSSHEAESTTPILIASGAWRDEVKLRRKDGSEFDAGLTVSVIGKPGEELVRAVTIVRDISKDKELEAQKARFIANAAHELRSPIANLSTRLYLMRRQPAEMEGHIQLLERIIKRINTLIEDMLDLSRFEHGVIQLRPQNVILEKLVEDVVEIQQPEADQKRVMLYYNPPSAPITVYADTERLIQVITNLVVNAIQYTHEGGRVEIATST